MRDLMRLKHYSYRTEQTYCDWVERFIRFHHGSHAGAGPEEELPGDRTACCAIRGIWAKRG